MKKNVPNPPNVLLWFAAACLLFLSCESPFSPTDDGDDDTSKPEEPPPCVVLSAGTPQMQPLAVGNYWVYHTWFITPNLVTIWREEITSSHQLDCLGGSFTAFGFKHVEHTQNNPRIPGAEWLSANSDRGLEGVGAISKSDTAILVSPRFKFPASLKETWDFETPNFNSTLDKFTSVSTIVTELVDTSAVFSTEFAYYENCLVFRYPEKGTDDAVYELHHYIYVKPGIGIVGRRTRDVLFVEDVDDPNLRIVGEWTLIDHNIEQ